MIRHATCAILTSLTLLTAVSAEAQRVTFSTISGTNVSNSVEAPAGTSVPLLTVPSQGHFILTQFCGTAAPVGNTLGRLPAGGGCTTFNPGFAVPPGEMFTCGTTGGGPFSFAVTCSITGVLSER